MKIDICVVPGQRLDIFCSRNHHRFCSIFRRIAISMPYILIRGNLASYSHKYPFRVLVSGLKGNTKRNDKFKPRVRLDDFFSLFQPLTLNN